MTLRPQSTLGAVFGMAYPLPAFRSPGAYLRERADMGCVLLSAAVNAAEIAHRVGAAIGVSLPLEPGITQRSIGLEALWLSPRSWLVCTTVDGELPIIACVSEAFPDKLIHATRFTDALCWLELSGLQSQDLLTEGSFLSLEPGGLPIGHAKRAQIAGVAALVIRRRESAWLLGVERSRARYFADWLTAAARSGVA